MNHVPAKTASFPDLISWPGAMAANRPPRAGPGARPGAWKALAARVIVAYLLIARATVVSGGETVSFRNQVMAVLSKAGCNAGTCHGNRHGKGGFKLSLRGQDPDGDFQVLTHGALGRRVNLVEPDQSLILLKPTTQVAHEGGLRFAKRSLQYEILEQWIGQGTPGDRPGTPVLADLFVTPLRAILKEPDWSVQIQASAVFSDGSIRNVQDLAVYEPADPFLKVSQRGLVTSDKKGESTVLVRFLDRQIPVRLMFVADPPSFVWDPPPVRNTIDEYVFGKLKIMKIAPSRICSDRVFIRRVYLDLLGILPTEKEARSFVGDARLGKRSRVIDGLLQRPEFADFWALKWADLLRVEERTLDVKGMHTFDRWIRQGIAQGKPLDQFVRELISARGSTYGNPPANFYRGHRTPTVRAESAAQVFLGKRLHCAQCHNHPFDRWTQDDYYDWQAVFGRVRYKILENRRRDRNDQHEFKGEQIVFLGKDTKVKNARTGLLATPRFLGQTRSWTPKKNEDELTALARWLTAPENPWFAKTQVNRIWYHLMGRGLVDPIDDFRATNPPTHPALLEWLANDFIQNGFDLRHTIRLILNSTTYQLSSEPNETNQDDEINYSHNRIRRLSAEQLLDSCSQVLGRPAKFDRYPLGFRAAQIPGALADRIRGRRPTVANKFLTFFGRPARELTCECERSDETTMGQAFQLISGPAINGMLTDPSNRLRRLLHGGKNVEESITSLYWSALTRPPSQVELDHTAAYLREAGDRRQALEDIAWGLINAKPFIFRH